jgi:hypothetical protein
VGLPTIFGLDGKWASGVMGDWRKVLFNVSTMIIQLTRLADLLSVANDQTRCVYSVEEK